MTLRNKIKTGIATLLVGGSLALGGCTKNVEGTVVKEFEGATFFGTLGKKVYIVKDNDSGKYYIGFFKDPNKDPFDVGDCARLKLGRFSDLRFPYYVDGKKVVEKGYEILEYGKCK